MGYPVGDDFLGLRARQGPGTAPQRTVPHCATLSTLSTLSTRIPQVRHNFNRIILSFQSVIPIGRNQPMSNHGWLWGRRRWSINNPAINEHEDGLILSSCLVYSL